MTAQVEKAPEFVCRQGRGDLSVPPVPVLPEEVRGARMDRAFDQMKRNAEGKNFRSSRRDLWCLCAGCMTIDSSWMTVGRLQEIRVDTIRRAESQRAARRALSAFLGEQAWAVYYHYGLIILTGSDDHNYRLTFGTSGNIYRHEGGDTFSEWCCHPEDFSCTEDCLLGQALALTTNAPRFMNRAVFNDETTWDW